MRRGDATLLVRTLSRTMENEADGTFLGETLTPEPDREG
jgi:hypothetical protein